MCAGAHARGGDFNPRSPHGERPRRWKLFFLHLLISIHAPRTGSDVKADDFAALIVRISIHAPRTGSDLAYADRMRWRTISIHAPRTGSDRHTKNTQPARNISIHAPRTGSDAQRHIQIGVHNLISIHAPRTGSDYIYSSY